MVVRSLRVSESAVARRPAVFVGTCHLASHSDARRDSHRPAHRPIHPMSVRRQLPVHSPIALAGLSAATVAAITRRRVPLSRVTAALRREFATPRVLLTDSGTSALVAALRLGVGKGNIVAVPGYSCFD